MKILVCNAGSTSLKFKLYDMPSEKLLCDAKIERVGSLTDAYYTYKNYLSGDSFRKDNLSVPDYKTGILAFIDTMTDTDTGVIQNISEVECVGFKTVISKGHNGVCELTEEVLQGMKDYMFISEGHTKAYLGAIAQFNEILPDVLKIGVFETSFHTTIPLERSLYSIPYEWFEKYGIKKMGYHGASHSYIAKRCEAYGKTEKVISCHLGGSCSVCAIENGKSVDNSWGFSLQTGVMHSSRCGTIDPYLVPFLLNEGMSLDEITTGLTKKGGLLGISGVSSDFIKVSEAADAGNERAKLAMDAFATSVVRYIAQFYVELGGADQIIFTGGIGEHSAEFRKEIVRRLSCLGIALDEGKNAAVSEGVISTAESKIKVCVIPTNEELGIAMSAYKYANENKEELTFEFAHMGVNMPDETACLKLCSDFENLFGFSTRDIPASAFSTNYMEIMKTPFKGEHGHIAIRTNDVEKAVEMLKNKGYDVDLDTARYKDGKMTFVYLKDEFAGFAIHLLQK